MDFKIFGSNNFQTNKLIQTHLSNEQIKEVEILSSVLPFKVNSYVLEELIDWNNIPNDPIFRLTFPQKGMLSVEDYHELGNVLSVYGIASSEFKSFAQTLYKSRNPHSSNQVDNIPEFYGEKLLGMQHKYEDTVLFFPKQSQTCHSYCTFCFRWPQFVESDNHKFAMKEIDLLIKYLNDNPKITDVIFTGGDPLVMSSKVLKTYIIPLINSNIKSLKTIRIGTKALGFWPYRFTTDKDAADLLVLFQDVVKKGYNLSIMAHFNHYRELRTNVVVEAIGNIQATGAKIWAQSPILKGINDSAEVWKIMWQDFLSLGIIPYYMFVPRDTGSHSYFALPLNNIFNIYNDSTKEMSGLSKIANGPVMSTDQGKIQIIGVSTIAREKYFILKKIRSKDIRNTGEVILAKWNDKAEWFNDLEIIE